MGDTTKGRERPLGLPYMMSTPFQDFFNPPASSPSLSAKFIPLIRKLGSPLCEELVEDVIYGGSLRRTDSNFYRACMSKKGGGGGSSLLHAPFLPSLSLALPINRFPLSSSGKSRDWTRKEGRKEGRKEPHAITSVGGRKENGLRRSRLLLRTREKERFVPLQGWNLWSNV